MSAIALENKTILVTGAAGFIGSNLVKRICEEVPSAKVVGIDSVNDYYDVALKEFRLNELSKYESFTFIKGNIANKELITEIFTKYKPAVVVNLAAQAGVRYSITNPDAYVEANLIGFYNILEACRHSYDDICSRRTQMKTMPEDPVTVKTIVTIDMAERIAAKYGVKTINVLTGFKFIGEQIGFLEKQGKEDSYIFGMEESYGYLSGSYVRDKDGVNAAFLICEMFTYYASQGIGLFEKLNELYLKQQQDYRFGIN